jgi:hypothetical protein
MRWEKLGLIFYPINQFDWMCSHATLPIALNMNDDIFRIYFSTRNFNNQSLGAFIEIDINNPSKILNISSEPVLIPGDLGTFDDSGVSLSCIIFDKLYYMGWNLLKTVPFSNHIGVSFNKNNTYIKHSILPIISKCENEPFSFGYPWVIFENGTYKMWYDIITSWNGLTTNDYLCDLRYAESKDGINWEKKNVSCLLLNPGEICICRPCVIKENGVFKMWNSINYKGKYKIGYAESNDGIIWERKDDEVGIDVSETGWDSEQIEYPFVFDHKGERYMLYNGNGYGKTGFGLAKLNKE